MCKDLTKRTTPGPSLKKGGEPYPSVLLMGVWGVHFFLPCSRWVEFPAFLQGGDRGGSPLKTLHHFSFNIHFSLRIHA
jgi:hypothetical protein